MDDAAGQYNGSGSNSNSVMPFSQGGAGLGMVQNYAPAQMAPQESHRVNSQAYNLPPGFYK